MYPRPLVLAHRGAHATAPENSMRALEAARMLRCDGVEFDVRRLGDGTLVLHHDPTVGRPGRRVALTELTLSGLRRGGRTVARAPLFETALQWAKRHPDVLLDVEIKDPASRLEVVRALAAARRGRSMVVTSFDLGTVRAVKRARPTWRVGWISHERNPGIPRLASESGLDLIVLHRSNASRPLLEDARRRGLAVWVWGVDKPPQARTLLGLGVEGFVTDAPATLVAMRDA